MNRFFAFLNRERIYFLLLSFIIIVTAMIVVTPHDKVKASGVSAGKYDVVSSREKIADDRDAVQKVLSENRYLACIFVLISLLVIALLLLGIIVDALFLSGQFSGKGREVGTYKLQSVKWGIWDVCRVVILYMFFDYIILLIEAFLIGVFPILKGNNFRMMLNSAVMDVLIVIFILYFTVTQYKEKLVSVGLSVKNFFKNVWYGVVAYIAVIPVLIGLIAMISVITNLTGYPVKKQPVIELFLKEKDMAFLLFTSLFAAIAGPIIEELFFRGFVYNAIRRYIGIFWATLITASIFAGLHAHLLGFLPILAIGIMLAYIYEKTGTLVSSITVHVIHNLCMVFLVFFVKQLGVY